MKRVRSHFHALQALKTADPNLSKAIISKCNIELVNCVCDCVLYVLYRNIMLTVCDTRKLQKHNAAHRKVVDRHVPLSGKKKLIVQRGGFLLHLLSAVLPSFAMLVVRNR